jgi:hypothetical protein
MTLKTMELIAKYKETYPEFYKRKIKAVVQDMDYEDINVATLSA